MIEDKMKEDIGKIFIWQGNKIEIINAFTCYEGDFYEYKIFGDDKVYRVNIFKDMSFAMSIPK
ncbi:hypothetical protein [Anaeromicropila herbilytica]|uniref:Uncharacterized protein n=1 Tax=Anaeromicropila herbilytica TaxID=2785025 RepID=A0A7R7EKY1_9FIRM|nr:hypothetical protein [Anaeromicropila herbilytica]BCN30684.1 hypothetical protein bsdtb5_19790 [Anaeromicropila herbilytica]